MLANEQVIDGKGWRSGAVVEKREIPQWFIRITAYADELLGGVGPDAGLARFCEDDAAQLIGRSTGIEVDFALADGGDPLRVFTTRPDTIFGATFMAVAAGSSACRRRRTEKLRDCGISASAPWWGQRDRG